MHNHIAKYLLRVVDVGTQDLNFLKVVKWISHIKMQKLPDELQLEDVLENTSHPEWMKLHVSMQVEQYNYIILALYLPSCFDACLDCWNAKWQLKFKKYVYARSIIFGKKKLYTNWDLNSLPHAWESVALTTAL